VLVPAGKCSPESQRKEETKKPMFTRTRSLIGALVVGTAMTAMVLSPLGAGSASAQNQTQEGLVNVAIGDVTVLRNVAAGVAAAAVVQACNLTVGDIAALTTQIAQLQAAETFCQVGQGAQSVPVTVAPSPSQGGGRGPNQRQAGLVNVAVGDVTIAENVAIGAAVQIAAQICGVTVGNIAALAAGVLQAQDATTVCTITQGAQDVPVTIAPAP